jgi:hypothetical protein
MGTFLIYLNLETCENNCKTDFAGILGKTFRF